MIYIEQASEAFKTAKDLIDEHIANEDCNKEQLEEALKKIHKGEIFVLKYEERVRQTIKRIKNDYRL